MTQRSTRRALVRLLALVECLQAARRGKTVPQLCVELEASRATVYRDLRSIEAAGIALQPETINGEVRYSLARASVPGVAVSSSTLAALWVARSSLRTLDGTQLVDELDALTKRIARELGASAPGARAAGTVSVGDASVAVSNGSVLRSLDTARIENVRAILTYQGRRDQVARAREVEPLCWRMHGRQLYVAAYDCDRFDYRVFKVARIGSVELTKTRASAHPDFDAEAYFARAVKAWGGGGQECAAVVRLSPRVARFAREWPLVADQQVERLGDGSVLVRARVAGWVETMRWVLGWGADAEAVSPRELRAAMREELRRAAGRYEGAVVRGVERVSQTVETGGR